MLVNYLIGSCNVYQSNQTKKINYDGVDAGLVLCTGNS
jgi:hypothetical protein